MCMFLSTHSYITHTTQRYQNTNTHTHLLSKERTHQISMTAAHDVHLPWCKCDVRIINSHGCISGALLVVLNLAKPPAECSPKIFDLGPRGSTLQNFLAKYPTHQYHHLHRHRWHKHQGTSGIIGPERERARAKPHLRHTGPRTPYVGVFFFSFSSVVHTPSSPLLLSSTVRHHC